MEHQIFSSYYQLSTENKVAPIRCINQEHESPLFPYWNILEDRTELRCLVGDCDFKIIPGLAMYQDMMKQVYYADK